MKLTRLCSHVPVAALLPARVGQDGYFNGDPHPGNIFLLDDGRMGLLDFGQVKQLSQEDRVKIAKLYVALYE